MTTEELVEDIQGLSSSDIESLRRECRKNLFFLARGVLGYKDMSVSAHGQFCRWIVESKKKRRLGLMPRAHLKTTIGSVADSVRIALDEPDHARILIASESATLAENILSEIKGHFEKNEILRGLFPELVPPRFSGPGTQWSATKASIVRQTAHKDATWTAIGVDGAVTGGHFTRIKGDDLIGLAAINSAAEMVRVKKWVDYMQPLLVNQHEDVIDFYGTRWSRNDLYAHIIHGYGSDLSVFTRRAIETDAQGNKFIIFPELHTQKEYDNIRRINPSQWYAQYENDPISEGASDLPAHLVRRYYREGEDVVIQETGERVPIASLDRILIADPNSGSLSAPDAAAISVQGKDHHKRIFQLESWSARLSPTDYVDKIYLEARRWNVRAIRVERAGQQNTDHYLREKMAREGWYVRVEEAKPKGRKKEDRIRHLLEPVIRLGQYFIAEHQTTLYKQLLEFPGVEGGLIDELDAAAYGVEFLRTPDASDEQTILDRKAMMDRMMARRSALTGY